MFSFAQFRSSSHTYAQNLAKVDRARGKFYRPFFVRKYSNPTPTGTLNATQNECGLQSEFEP